MVTTLIKLRFRLLANSLRRSTWQLVGAIIGALYGVGFLVLAMGGLFALSFAPNELARTVITLAGATLTLGWMLVPLLVTGIDQTLDPARLATFPIPREKLLLALTVSGILGIPGIITSIAALAVAAAWWRFPAAAIAALVCAVVAVLTCVIGSRMFVALASRAGSGRRAREAKGMLFIIPLILLGPILIGLTRLVETYSADLPDIATVLGWTPIGAVWAVPADLASGDVAAAGVKFLIALATLALLVVVWRVALARALEQPAQARTEKKVRGSGFFAWFPDTPSGAVAARALTYWIRDPRYAQSLILVPLVPLLILFLQGFTDATGWVNAVGPIIALLMALSTFADISFDHTAFALHLQTGVSGRDDRIGRILALAIFSVPISLLVTVGSVWFTGTWSHLPGLLAITIGILLASFGISSVLSSAFVLPVPLPGENPFAVKTGAGLRLGLLTYGSFAAVGVLILPELVLAIIGFVRGESGWGWIALAVSLVTGTLMLWWGISWGGRMLDKRGPELLTKMRAQG